MDTKECRNKFCYCTGECIRTPSDAEARAAYNKIIADYRAKLRRWELERWAQDSLDEYERNK